MCARREQARRRHAERMEAAKAGQTVAEAEAGVQLTEEQMAKLTLNGSNQKEDDSKEGDMAFVAFARVFSGVLKPGKEVNALTLHVYLYLMVIKLYKVGHLILRRWHA